MSQILHLNPLLRADTPVAIVVPYRPVLLKVAADGTFTKDGTGTVDFYSALVYSPPTGIWYIWEFDRPAMDVLEAVRFRDSGGGRRELFVSRYPDGSLKIEPGPLFGPLVAAIGEAQAGLMAGRAERLLDKYCKFASYKIQL